MRHREKWALGALLVLATLAAYWPALKGGFIWSDESYLTKNEMIRAGNGLARFWFTTEPADYWPVTATTFWAEWRLWGAHPLGYHVTNLALHLGESLLLWAVLRRLEIKGASVAVLLFALHPVNVQSVAWIVERKNLLAMLFYLLSIWFFLLTGFASPQRSTPGPESKSPPNTGRWYAASVLAYVLAMLSKGSVALLPVVLVGLIGFRRRFERKDVIRLAPFFVVGAALAGVNVWFQGHHLSESIRQAGWVERLLGAGAAVWFYLGKALVPVNLIFVYPAWHLRAENLWWWLPLVGAVLVTGWLWRARHTRARAALIAWGYFCVSLVPVLGFVDVYFMKYSLVGDHYQHLALIGVVVFAGWIWAGWRVAPGIKIAVATLAMGALGLQTWRQCLLYRDEEALFSATIALNPESWLARNNRGVILAASGRIDAAIDDFQEALRLKPDYTDAHVDLGNALGERGRVAEAIGQFAAALALEPRRDEALEGLAITLVAAGRPGEALDPYRRALELKPNSAPARHGLGLALAMTGHMPEALVQLEEAVRLAPNDTGARIDLGSGLSAEKRFSEAEIQFRAALQILPRSAKANFNLGNVLSHQGRFAEAIPPYQAALQSAPDNPAIHHNLAVALAAVGRQDEAEAHYRLEAAPPAAETP